MKKEFDKFWISQVGILIRDNKCLILEFAGRPGKWGLPGGRIDVGEHCDESFSRELKEELDLDNFEILGIVDFDTWVTLNTRDHVGGVARLIKNDNDKIKLSREHTQLAWAREEEIDNYNFLWPNAKRMIKKGFEYLRKYEK